VRTNHAPDGKIGDSRTVTNRILALQPKQKFSFQIAEVPEGIPMVAMLVGTYRTGPPPEDRARIEKSTRRTARSRHVRPALAVL